MTNFHKMHGCGNDFILIDNRSARVPVAFMPVWARALCARKLGVGADGLVFLENTPPDREGAYIWHFYNADGSRGEMCGNASRCAAWLAVELGLAGPRHAFGTDAGLVRAFVRHAERHVTVELTRPGDTAFDLALEVDGETLTGHFINTGVPHLVVFMPDVSAMEDADVARLGALLRHHPRFAPAGTNVNFVTVDSANALRLRTYERGVEAETLACGTGAAAAVCIAYARALTGSHVNVTTTGGEILGIELRDGAVFLSGAAERVFTGALDVAALSAGCGA